MLIEGLLSAQGSLHHLVLADLRDRRYQPTCIGEEISDALFLSAANRFLVEGYLMLFVDNPGLTKDPKGALVGAGLFDHQFGP